MLVKFTEPERLAFKSPEGLTVSQAAARYVRVTSGPRPGLWKNEVTPYLVGPMDALNRPGIREVILCFPPQSGKTRGVAMNFVSWAALEDPDTLMVVLPDEKTAGNFMKRRLMPMFQASPVLRKLLSPSSYDQTRYRIQLMNGMDIFVAWAGSPAELASESVRYVVFDEVDKYPEFSGRESDPISLGRARQIAFPHTRKTVTISTPTVVEGNIWSALEKEADTVFDYHVCCPKCGAFQFMEFSRVKWPEDVRDPKVMRMNKPARYECSGCQAQWTDYQRNKAVSSGRWIPREEVSGAQVLGYHMPAMVSPFVSMSDTASAFLAGKNDPAKHMYFINNHLAMPWRNTIKPVEADALQAQISDLPRGHVPDEALALTLAADMQLHGFYYTVFAHAANPRRTWLIEYGTLNSWDDLHQMVFEARWPVLGSDAQMGIWRAALDTGGGQSPDGVWSRTEEAYLWLRQAGKNKIHGTKGSSHGQLSRVKRTVVDKLPHKNRPLPGGLVLYLLDTGSLKDVFFWRLSEDSSQPIYFHRDTGPDFFDQLTAEQKKKDRRGKESWIQVKRHNHFLDCCMMTMALIDASWFPALERMPGKINLLTPENKEKTIPKKTKPKPATRLW